MQLTTLMSNLPPPRGEGWPWVPPESSLAADLPLDQLPVISIVTPSFNQGEYLEETIRSVLLQGYPRLEYYVMDGGSTDRSVEILRQYAPWLTGWVSERDRGQSDAINRGFARCTGDVVNWLCSDDLLEPGALWEAARQFVREPEVDVVAGAAEYVFENQGGHRRVATVSAANVAELPSRNSILQAATFYRRRLLRTPLAVREDLHYVMDRELWCHFIRQGARWAFVDQPLAIFRVTGTNKSFVGGDRILRELEKVYGEYAGEPLPLVIWFRYLWLPLHRLARRLPGGQLPRAPRVCWRIARHLLRNFYSPSRLSLLEMQYGLHSKLR